MQQDVHAWLDVLGESWAIQRIRRQQGLVIINLRRGHEPRAEYLEVYFCRDDLERYTQTALAMMRRTFPEVGL